MQDPTGRPPRRCSQSRSIPTTSAPRCTRWLRPAHAHDRTASCARAAAKVASKSPSAGWNIPHTSGRLALFDGQRRRMRLVQSSHFDSREKSLALVLAVLFDLSARSRVVRPVAVLLGQVEELDQERQCAVCLVGLALETMSEARRVASASDRVPGANRGGTPLATLLGETYGSTEVALKETGRHGSRGRLQQHQRPCK
jgi:hypothetical protein